jgi:hypothetical protein
VGLGNHREPRGGLGARFGARSATVPIELIENKEVGDGGEGQNLASKLLYCRDFGVLKTPVTPVNDRPTPTRLPADSWVTISLTLLLTLETSSK